MLLVALTGGIGSGKSTVARLLEERGAAVVDADAAAREVVEPGRPALAALVERFGEGILLADGRLDRAGLAADRLQRRGEPRALNGITHPAIGEEFLRQVDAAPPDGVVVHDVPLLVEGGPGSEREYAAVIVVEAPRELRLDRLEARGARPRRRGAADGRSGRRRGPSGVRDLGRRQRRRPRHLERQVDAIWPELERPASAEQGA